MPCQSLVLHFYSHCEDNIVNSTPQIRIIPQYHEDNQSLLISRPEVPELTHSNVIARTIETVTDPIPLFAADKVEDDFNPKIESENSKDYELKDVVAHVLQEPTSVQTLEQVGTFLKLSKSWIWERLFRGDFRIFSASESLFV